MLATDLLLGTKVGAECFTTSAVPLQTRATYLANLSTILECDAESNGPTLSAEERAFFEESSSLFAQVSERKLIADWEAFYGSKKLAQATNNQSYSSFDDKMLNETETKLTRKEETCEEKMEEDFKNSFEVLIY